MFLPLALLSIALTLPQGSPTGPAGERPGMPWQRNLEDALALSRASGRPLLICVNMDGEAASERLARGRYRDPAFHELVAGFVPILASPSRHGERDHDARGRRISDPRFGRVVESEHLTIEPELYARYFDGRRVAPRHVGVAPDGTILFDLFLLGDLGAIDRALREHGKFDGPSLAPTDSDASQLLASPDAGARDRLEARFVDGDEATRIQLAQGALSAERATQHPELIRMALLDDAPQVRRAAARAVAANPAPAAEFLSAAVQASHGDPTLRAQLVEALQRLGQEAQEPELRRRAQRLGSVFAGLARPSPLLASERWFDAFGATEDMGRWDLSMRLPELPSPAVGDGGEPLPAGDTLPLETELMRLERELSTAPRAPELNAQFAYRALELAKVWIREGGGNPGYMLKDVCAAADRALAAGATDPMAAACLARARYLLGDMEGGLAAVEAALPELDRLASSGLALDALDVFIQGRLRAVYDALAQGSEVSSEWIADARAAFEVAIRHPRAGVDETLAYLGFLDAIEAWTTQRRLVFEGLERFPSAAGMHSYLRRCVLRDEGAQSLARVYEGLRAPEEWAPAFEWFFGLALFEAAEATVREGDMPQALALYHRCAERFVASFAQEPGFEGTASYYIGLAHAAIARRLLEQDRLSDALTEIVQAAEHPVSFSAPDGFGRTPRQTAYVIERELKQAGREDELAQLRQRLEPLSDPEPEPGR